MIDLTSSSDFWQQFFFYAPLGIIGAWRWSVWLFQVVLKQRYRPVPNSEAASRLSLGVVTPVYNEDPELFLWALHSWKQNGVQEIVAVIDHTDKACIEAFQNFQKDFPHSKLIITEEPGKRPALSRGTRETTSEIVALVDSDTVWDENIREPLLAPFADPKVGGVGPRQTVIKPDTLARKLFALRFDLTFFHSFPYFMSIGDLVICISGRTAVYRREALLPVLDDMVYETFLGKPCISGEDKRLTSLIQRNGWKTIFQQNACVRTPGEAKLLTFSKQGLRWARNSWRTDIGTFFSRWSWKRSPLFCYHLLDRAISPFTLLLGPIYLAIGLYFQYWLGAIILVAWWFISRTFRIWPHLRQNPADFKLLPAFLVFQYAVAVIKIYALLSLDYQSWLTRWHRSRLGRPFWELFPSQLATATLVIGLAFVIFQYQESEAREHELKIAQKAFLYTTDFSRFPLDEEAEALEREISAHRFATYVTRSGDTPQFLMDLWNLPPEAYVPLFGNRAGTALLAAGIEIIIPIEYLQVPRSSARIVARNPLPQISYTAADNTIRVQGEGSVVNLGRLRAALPQYPELLVETGPKEWLLRSNLYVGEGVTLVMSGSEAVWLKLASSPRGFVYVRSYNGSILIEDTKITSWDEERNDVDNEWSDGRAFVGAYANGRMDVLRSEIAYLGYPLEKKQSTFGAIYGLSWRISDGTIDRAVMTGVVEESRIHDNYFGLYTFGASGWIVRRNEVYQNVQYGIDPHDDSHNLLIEDNFVHGNGNHGIIGSKRVRYSVIRNNRSINNRLHGLMLDRQSNSNLVEHNFSSGNVNGLALYDSHRNIVRNNSFLDNRYGIRANMGASENRFSGNVVRGGERGFFLYAKAEKNVIIDNVVTENEQGVNLKDAHRNIIKNTLSGRDNTLSLKYDDASRNSNFIEPIP